MTWHLTPYDWCFNLRGLPLNFAIAGVATLAFLLFGYDMSIMGGLVTEDSFKTVFPELNNSGTLGIVIASFELGALFGALACLDLGDRLGRRLTVQLGMVFMLIGGILQTSAWSTAQLTVGRVISGSGLGLQVATVPSWQAECAKGKSRGRWVMIEGGLQTTGVAIGQWVGYGFYYVTGQIQWRVPVGLQLIPALIVVVSINFLPESPRWLVKHGFVSEATRVLARLRDLDESHPTLVHERDAIVASFEAQKGEAPFRYRELFQNGKSQTFRRIALGFFFQSAQQLSGINLVSTYSNLILQESFQLDGGMSHLITACGGTEYAICSLLSVFLIEGLGRRKSFLITASLMAVTLIAISVLLSTDQRINTLVGAGLLFLFNTWFGLCWVGGPFLYSAEIAPLRVRSQANAIASAGNWIFAFMVVMIVPPAIANIGWRTYVIFAVLNAAFVPIIYFFCVEAKGRSLEDLDIVFAAVEHGYDPVKVEQQLPYDLSVEEMRQRLGLPATAGDVESDVKDEAARVPLPDDVKEKDLMMEEAQVKTGTVDA